MPKSRPPYSPEFRRQMIDLVRAGRSPEGLAREFEPTAQSIGAWVSVVDRQEGRREEALPGLAVSERDELARLHREDGFDDERVTRDAVRVWDLAELAASMAMTNASVGLTAPLRRYSAHLPGCAPADFGAYGPSGRRRVDASARAARTVPSITRIERAIGSQPAVPRLPAATAALLTRRPRTMGTRDPTAIIKGSLLTPASGRRRTGPVAPRHGARRRR